ncbi:serine/threonine-protein kinase Nek2-like [Carassius carassius]|uniref:serine/threonine-protein kinase Nek2-like n=1 Tax=Carassius carassius TaxID=217509 RepID=UPI002869765C|nr:serine/threonine-protein kinase Nek2-like [Carassius carassius]
MGSNQSVLKDKGYTIVSEEENKSLVKNKGGDQFVIKQLNADQDDVSNFLEKLKHPHIVEHKETIKDRHCLYLVMELCEGGDLTHKIYPENKGTVAFSEREYSMAEYLYTVSDQKLRSTLTRYRLSGHKLMIETGRHMAASGAETVFTL